jgi:sigma-B regulation protein RsbU (phosphoserine phosphatase)
MKILVAEDNRTEQLVLRASLQRLGHEVVVVGDGQAALDALEQQPFPLVISDWMMPRVSGVELCRAVRAREAQRLAEGKSPGYTYLILLTALDGKANYLEGMDAGADDLLTKPLDNEQLAARLRVAGRILDLMKQTQQLEGLLPICSYCKRIREGDASAGEAATWVPVESYVSSRTEASFSHGVCPSCYAQHLKPQLDELRRTRAGGE